MAFAYLAHTDNHFASAGTTLTPSTQNPAYLATNTKTPTIAEHWRTNGVASESLQIDLGSAKAIDLVGLVNHNLSPSAVITLNGGSSANPNGSQFTTTISWRQYDAFKLFAAQTWRYWKLIIADTGNTNGYLRIGYILLGDAAEPTFSFRYGVRISDEMINYERASAFGTLYVEHLYEQIRIEMQFGPVTSTDIGNSGAPADTLRALFRSLKRNLSPLFLIPDTAKNEGYFGRIVNQFQRTVPFHVMVDSVVFLTDSRGRVVAA